MTRRSAIAASRSPALYEQAAARFPDLTPATSLMIGDSLADMEFGRNLRMKTILVQNEEERSNPAPKRRVRLADLHFASLSDAVDWLLLTLERPI
jgi:phosphoglycolate phosphatase-like HAD superfamily hydrolase